MENTKELTLERILAFEDVNEGIEFAKEFYPASPEKKAKPVLGRDATAKDAKAYALSLEVWEKGQIEYNKALKQYHDDYNNVKTLIEEYIMERSGYNKLPEKAKDKVWSKAWSDGHSSGYIEVYYCLCGLVDLFDY